jgi:hypothetical protein
MTLKAGAVLLLIALAAASAGVVAAGSGAPAGAAANPLRYAAHDLFIETNATDRDAGLQVGLDAEDWRSLQIRDPKGRLLVDVEAKGRLRGYGLTELFFEASEPSFAESPFSQFKRRFPEGRYSFSGRTVEGRRLTGSDRLSHVVPAGPNVTFPTKGAAVDHNGFTVTWEPVTKPAGVDIVRYIVIVTQEGRDLSMELSSSATSASIPREFLKPDTTTGLEVLAREKSGNQTISLVEFRTT